MSSANLHAAFTAREPSDLLSLLGGPIASPTLTA